MQRKKLKQGYGMIFVFDNPQKVRFSMLNTLFPLDVIFIRNNRIVSYELNVLPCLLCDPFGPDILVDNVIEVAHGEVHRLNIKIGDKVDIKYYER